jgi:hypothetical protein
LIDVNHGISFDTGSLAGDVLIANGVVTLC